MSGPTTLPHCGIARHGAAIPAHERVLDVLAELLLAADQVLETLQAEDAMKLAWVEHDVRQVYDITNALMTKLSD